VVVLHGGGGVAYADLIQNYFMADSEPDSLVHNSFHVVPSNIVRSLCVYCINFTCCPPATPSLPPSH
jgi:hypothetical protein